MNYLQQYIIAGIVHSFSFPGLGGLLNLEAKIGSGDSSTAVFWGEEHSGHVLYQTCQAED